MSLTGNISSVSVITGKLQYLWPLGGSLAGQ